MEILSKSPENISINVIKFCKGIIKITIFLRSYISYTFLYTWIIGSNSIFLNQSLRYEYSLSILFPTLVTIIVDHMETQTDASANDISFLSCKIRIYVYIFILYCDEKKLIKYIYTYIFDNNEIP